MALVKCRECGTDMSDQAANCPKCGAPGKANMMLGYEYRSERTFLGLPLLHIARGIDPVTGRKRVAKGFIAIGDIAVGVFAVGGVALGGVTFGGVSLGVFAAGGLAIGVLLAAGGAALGGVALGGAAIGVVALGGAAIGLYGAGGGVFAAHPLRELFQ